MRTLSLVVPVYNAPDLARTLLGHIPELAQTARACGFELVETILVDDGSEPPLELAAGTPPVTLLRNARNRGKGFAVRCGVLAAKGGWALMSDVDLSAPLTEFAKLAEGADAWMVCGSRSGRLGMPLRRRFLSWLFHVFVRLIGVRGVHDTQCGFKLFRMDVMRAVFMAQRIERFAFDVELIRRVLRAGGTIREVPILWRGGMRSSLRVLRDAPRMLWDLLRIRDAT
ncbi:MAG: glycosyltransferase [Kiritimatiellia bacterium]